MDCNVWFGCYECSKESHFIQKAKKKLIPLRNDDEFSMALLCGHINGIP